jgi:catechol 2,3-dioxygenase-like lactoylglutathione lyase family enzyme
MKFGGEILNYKVWILNITILINHCSKFKIMNQTCLRGNIKGLQHLGIPVTNLQASVDFYQKLGFEKILISNVDVPEENDAVKVAFVEQKGVILELYQVTRKNLEELRSRKDGHLDHIAFDVADVEKAFQELKQENYVMVEEKPVFLNFWNRGCKYFAIRGPDGEKLEFNQIL